MNKKNVLNKIHGGGVFSYLNIPVLTCLYSEIVKYRWDKFIPSFCVEVN